MDSKFLNQWYQFHKQLHANYSKLLTVAELGHYEIQEMKLVYDIHQAFGVNTHTLSISYS